MIYFEQAEIDRGFFEKIRRRLVADGRLPDVRLFSGNAQGLVNAKKALEIASNSDGSIGNLVEVFGVSERQVRGEVRNAKIYVNYLGLEAGRIGLQGNDYEWDEDLQAYHEIPLPDSTVNLNYEVRFVGEKLSDFRYFNKIMLQLFGVRNGFLKGWKDDGTETEEAFEYQCQKNMDLSSRSEKFFENVFLFKVKDVLISKNEPNADTVKGLVHLEVSPIVGEKFIGQVE